MSRLQSEGKLVVGSWKKARICEIQSASLKISCTWYAGLRLLKIHQVWAHSNFLLLLLLLWSQYLHKLVFYAFWATKVYMLMIPLFKHEYLRSRAYICLSLSSSDSHLSSNLIPFIIFQSLLLSRYSCLHLGSLHPRIFDKRHS